MGSVVPSTHPARRRLIRSVRLKTRIKLFHCAAIVNLALLPALRCQGSVSDPPEIQIKENLKIGTTTDPAVRILAQHVLVSSIPDDQQTVRFELIANSDQVNDDTTLFVIDPANDTIAITPLKSTRDGAALHYIFHLKKPYINKSTIHILFKDGLTKRLLLGTTTLPKSGKREVAENIGIVTLKIRINKATGEKEVWSESTVTIQNTKTRPMWVFGKSMDDVSATLFIKEPKSGLWTCRSKELAGPGSRFHEIAPGASFSIPVELPEELSRTPFLLEYRSYYRAEAASFVTERTKELSLVTEPPGE